MSEPKKESDMNILGTVKSTQLFIRKLMNSVWAVLLLVGLTVYANAQTKDVNIQKMLFVPQTITISVGDVVRWVNKERRQYHSVWFEALGDPEPDYFFPLMQSKLPLLDKLALKSPVKL